MHHEFNELMEEENRIVQQRGLSDRCYAYVTGLESGTRDGWLESITTESLQVRFEGLATEAGIALGSPPGTLPLKYWLHRLFLDLRANNSPLIRIHNDTGGFIEHLFEASAIYCARLDRRSLEKTVMPGEDSSVKQGVASPDAIAEPERRRGYRTEVRQWMALEGLRTIEAAARHLGISHSSLKSIMSDRGKCRYGEERLSRVLGRIGYKGE
ncbi:MAG TPA: hypothetical protein VNU44_19940 [Bryobacteraceae bacterium]|nr:hypothetical protein [Bryobacteraceae bacterium]